MRWWMVMNPIPPQAPTNKAAHGSYLSHPAHRATIPARAPLRVIRKLQGWAKRNLLMKRTARPPVEAPRMVFTMARATTLPSSAAEMLPWEPPLKARKPKMRIKPPRPARGTE